MSTAPYNMCDYWCERCDYASECPVYEKTRKRGGYGDFVEEVRGSLNEAMGMLHNMAEKLKIDLNDVDTSDEEVISVAVRSDPLVELAHGFTLKTHRLLGRIKPFVTDQTSRFFEELQWYHTLVAVKTQRSMRSLYEGFTEDAMNSADIVRKSVDSCITALASLGETCPDVTQECDVLRHTAKKIRSELDMAIPLKT